MWWFFIKAAVSVPLVVLIFHNIDIATVLRQLRAVDPHYLLLAAASYAMVGIPSALRWSIILRTMDYLRGFRITFPIVLIGYFFNLTLISAVGGDAVRMWLMARTGVPARTSINSVAVDRLTQYAAHLILVLAALALSFPLSNARTLRDAAFLVLIASVAAYIVGIQFDLLSRWLPWLRKLSLLIDLSKTLRKILLTPAQLFSTISLGLCNQCGVLGVVIILAKALALPVTWWQCLIVVPLAILATTIPISIGGWGMREGAFVLGFQSLSIPAGDALSLSILFGIVNTVVRLPGGIVWLFYGSQGQIDRYAKKTFT